ncbi:hypothetical protein CKO28_19075 [Rhodovibrio sodomensis]|uniref:Uncharacterized protein n=1 Tax=Rhodovibrio sodomensis TaxID=1088 RepID=A0ABS1DJ61_9PROT|nr:hypothetical protein [Rhodovibrio sodomensis]MBK1670142.1 hypothetical protein [Rhodovibrio sodomensis]
MAQDERRPRAEVTARADRGPDAPRPCDPAQAIRGYRGARRRLVVRVAIGSRGRSTGAWASGLMLALVATSALVAGAFSLAAP